MEHIKRVLRTFPGVFSGIGEFTIHKEFVSSKVAGEVGPGLSLFVGVCCGAATSAPALAVVEQQANRKVPALGYGVGCALGNVILALWGGRRIPHVGLTSPALHQGAVPGRAGRD